VGESIKCGVLKVVTALGKTWHPEHFCCAHCRKELGSKNFYEREGQPYCEDDYHQLYSPRCAYCNGPILDVKLLKTTPSRERGIVLIVLYFPFRNV
jgi:hypothetical protein